MTQDLTPFSHYDVRARWYDPDAGRFVSEDPAGLEGGINPYVFAGNDPVNGADPSGEDQYLDRHEDTSNQSGGCVYTVQWQYYRDTGTPVPGSLRVIDVRCTPPATQPDPPVSDGGSSKCGVQCTFSQSTGHLVCVNNGKSFASASGYAGAPGYQNNPAAQTLSNKGPLPVGT